MRETDGLAMSSRNMRLTPAQRQIATGISKVLFAMRDKKSEGMGPQDLVAFGNALFVNYPEIRVEYLAVADGDTLEELSEWNSTKAVALFAGYVGEIRLIDNILL